MKNKMRVWHFSNGNMRKLSVTSVEEAKKVIRQLMAKDLADTNIEENAFGLEEFLTDTGYSDIDDTWSEWGDGEGRDIIEIIDEEDKFERIKEASEEDLIEFYPRLYKAYVHNTELTGKYSFKEYVMECEGDGE